MAAYFFLWRFALRRRDTAACCLGGLAAGAALGTKSVGVVFVPPLLCLAVRDDLCTAVASPSQIRRGPRSSWLAPVVSGGFWYVRNALLTGNPLYPLELEILGRRVLTGWYLPEAMHTSPYYLPVTDWRALGDILFAVLDPSV